MILFLVGFALPFFGLPFTAFLYMVHKAPYAKAAYGPAYVCPHCGAFDFNGPLLCEHGVTFEPTMYLDAASYARALGGALL
jgi:hypothetical protein